MRVLALLMLLASVPVAAAEEEDQRFRFAAPVTVGADGSVSVGEIEWVQGPLAEVVRAELGKFPYIPGRLEGVAVDSQVLVDGVLLLHPVDGEFQVTLEDVETQPLLMHWRPVDYPVEMLRAGKDGVATLVLQVGPDGRVGDIEVVSRTNRGIARAARVAAINWRFAPTGTEFEVGATFWAHGNAEATDIPTVDCAVPAQLAHLPGDDGCMRISETTGVRVRRGDPVVPVLRYVAAPALPAATGERTERN